MQRFTIVKGATSQIIPISVYDSSSTIGAKLAGLVFNTASLTAYYNRMGASGAATVITLVTATKGTWVSSGFVAIDGTNMPGDYELHLPDAVVASGVDRVAIQLKGAANMVPINVEIDLVAFDLQTASTPQTGDSFARLGAPAGASVSVDIADIPTVSEFEARTIISASYALEATLGSPAGASMSADIADLPTVTEFNARTIISANYALEASLFDPTDQLTESYAAVNVAPTMTQAVLWIMQSVSEQSVLTTVETIKKIDGSTTAGTNTLDSATAPTSRTATTRVP